MICHSMISLLKGNHRVTNKKHVFRVFGPKTSFLMKIRLPKLEKEQKKTVPFFQKNIFDCGTPRCFPVAEVGIQETKIHRHSVLLLLPHHKVQISLWKNPILKHPSTSVHQKKLQVPKKWRNRLLNLKKGYFGGWVFLPYISLTYYSFIKGQVPQF